MGYLKEIHGMTLLGRTPEGTCPECAVKHDPEQPHNRDSLTYQYKFYDQHGRWPTWADAMAHCPDVLEKHEWAVSSYTDDGRVEIEKYSPAGEDFLICVEVENFPDAVMEYYESFDVDDHIDMWVEARRNGVSGIPSTRRLAIDAEAIDEMLKELAYALAEVTA